MGDIPTYPGSEVGHEPLTSCRSGIMAGSLEGSTRTPDLCRMTDLSLHLRLICPYVSITCNNQNQVTALDDNLILQCYNNIFYHKEFKEMGYNISSLLAKINQFQIESNFDIK